MSSLAKNQKEALNEQHYFQTAVAIDIAIFKESVLRLCASFRASHEGVIFADKGSIPVFVLPVIEP